MAALALGAAILCITLPDTHNQPTLENLSHDPDEDKNEKNDEEEYTTLIWRQTSRTLSIFSFAVKQETNSRSSPSLGWFVTNKKAFAFDQFLECFF